MPPGGNGFYYFSVYLRLNGNEYGRFDIQINGAVICSAYTEQTDTPFDGQTACSAAIYATEGF